MMPGCGFSVWFLLQDLDQVLVFQGLFLHQELDQVGFSGQLFHQDLDRVWLLDNWTFWFSSGYRTSRKLRLSGWLLHRFGFLRMVSGQLDLRTVWTGFRTVLDSLPVWVGGPGFSEVIGLARIWI